MTDDGRMPSSVSNSQPDPWDRPASVPGQPHAGADPAAGLESDESPVQRRQELRRRIEGAAGTAAPGSSDSPPTIDTSSADGGGRHARKDGQSRPPRLHYVPRHSADTPDPALVSPTDVTEVLSKVRQDPTEAPRPARPEPEPLKGPTPPEPADSHDEEQEESPADPPAPGKRVRVVLAQRRRQTRPVRTVVDVQELTQVGEVLSNSLIRSQLALALRIGGIAALVLGSLPVLFFVFPVLGRVELFGLRLPWLLLGVLAYPFLFTLGWVYARSAERLEQMFADHIQT